MHYNRFKFMIIFWILQKDWLIEKNGRHLTCPYHCRPLICSLSFSCLQASSRCSSGKGYIVSIIALPTLHTLGSLPTRLSLLFYSLSVHLKQSKPNKIIEYVLILKFSCKYINVNTVKKYFLIRLECNHRYQS